MNMTIRFAVASLLLIGMVPFFARSGATPSDMKSNSSSEVLFNMNWLRGSWQGANLPQLPDGKKVYPEIRDSYDVVRIILKNCPDDCVVYPSEGYFYFKFYSGSRLISGNLRFCDSQDGIVHFGYFDEYDRSYSGHGQINHSVNGEVICQGQEVKVSFEGMTRIFKLDSSWETKPSAPLLDDEELISGVLDESGHYFHLLYNSKVKQFVFLRDMENECPEQLIPIDFGGGGSFLLGLRSRFVFLKLDGRQILVGVHSDNIKANNFFDGPFDQVPPRLQIKSKLESAYPYVKLRGGIDDHGNFEEVYGSRVAISPYVKYTAFEEFRSRLSKALDAKVSGEATEYFGFTFESKSKFHEGVSR